jgi:hypothetical protein
MSQPAYVTKSVSPSRDKEKKNRLSRLLGKREKTPEPTAETGKPSLAAPTPDSAYGSSEANSADGPHGIIPESERHGGEMIPAEKNSDIANIDQDRNLAVKPSTGEVFDEDTGEIVTVVTTTASFTGLGLSRFVTNDPRLPLLPLPLQEEERGTRMSKKMSRRTFSLIEGHRHTCSRCPLVLQLQNQVITLRQCPPPQPHIRADHPRYPWPTTECSQPSSLASQQRAQ